MKQVPLCIQPLPGIGDMLWFLPHLRAIADHTPAKKIYILTKKSSLADQLLENEPWVAGFIWLKRDHRQQKNHVNRSHDGILGRWYLAQELKRYQFKQAWSLHHSNYYPQVMALAGIKERYGFSISKRRWLLNNNTVLAADFKSKPFREQVTTFLQERGYDLQTFHHPLGISNFARSVVQEKLGAKPRVRVALGIGASEADKVWPWEKFAQLANHLNQLEGGVQVCLCGGTSERATAEKINAHYAGQPGLLFNGTDLPLQQSLALIESCDLYIGNDTSLMNMAVNQGRKAITLFGPTYTVYSDLTIPVIAQNQNISSISVEAVMDKVLGNL